MEYGIITRSRDGLRTVCKVHDLDEDDVYVIASMRDLMFMLSECTHTKVKIHFADDAPLKESEAFDYVYKHNREFD